MNELALFAGGGGGILGGHILGWRTVCAVEFDSYARNILLARQRDGFIPRFPIWDDVRNFDGKPWRGRVDVVSGGFPCQDISAAGKGAGIEGERSGLWKHMARIVGEVRPRFVWVENSPMLVHRGLSVVLADLAAMGYDARWGVVGAHHAGAPHKRDRIWILADASGLHGERLIASDTHKKQWQEPRKRPTGPRCNALGWWATEPYVGRVADGMAAGVDPHGANAAGYVGRVGVRIPNRGPRLKAIGNGQCPQAMAIAWKILSGE